MRNESAWERDERINEREREKFPHSKGTSDLLYDASGEPRSDEWWDSIWEEVLNRAMEEECCT